jgi:hypothetical protein
MQQQQQTQQVASFDGPGEDEHSPSLLIDSSSSSSSSNSTDSQKLWGWVLAEVGLAAQKQLASGVPSVTTVAALDGPSADAAAAADGGLGSSDAVVSATVRVLGAEGAPAAVQALEEPQVAVEADSDASSVAADAGSSSSSSSSVTGSAGSSRVTKNQDPGLPVDADAIANPGERCLLPTIACCASNLHWNRARAAAATLLRAKRARRPHAAVAFCNSVA